MRGTFGRNLGQLMYIQGRGGVLVLIFVGKKVNIMKVLYFYPNKRSIELQG